MHLRISAACFSAEKDGELDHFNSDLTEECARTFDEVREDIENACERHDAVGESDHPAHI